MFPLQPIDAAIGRSFKAAFLCLLVDIFLHYAKRVKNGDLSCFKLNQAVTMYDDVRLIAVSWDLVPKSVVLNGWKA